jgi:hypothetical protein
MEYVKVVQAIPTNAPVIRGRDSNPLICPSEAQAAFANARMSVKIWRG